MAQSTILETRELIKEFADRRVVDHVSVMVHEREIVGLLGRNGAGKTTTFRMIVGMILPDSGSVIFEEQDISSLPMYRRARMGMGYLSQEPSVFQRMTVEQNLLAILETMNLSRSERQQRAEELVRQFDLAKVRHQHARLLSGGERRKLEIARALVTHPSLILLDEPFSGVDPIAVEDLQREIVRLRESGISILITDHNVERTLEVVDKAYIINEGTVFAYGPPRELVKDERVRKTYLGQTFRGDEFDRLAGGGSTSGGTSAKATNSP